MRNKTDKEKTDIAKKAWVTRLKNQKKFKFKNTDGINKIEFRKIKALAYKELALTDGNLLLLPSQTCADIYEINHIIPYNNFHYIGAEINKHAVKEIKNKIVKDNLNLIIYPDKIQNLIKSSVKNQYLHIDLDLCGTFSKNHQLLEDVIKNDLVKVGGVISSTFSVRDAKIKITSKRILGCVKYRKELNKCNSCLIKPTIKEFIKINGRQKYKIIYKPTIYTDKGLGGYMLFTMIKRIK